MAVEISLNKSPKCSLFGRKPLADFYSQGVIQILTWMNNYIYFKVWGEITYLFPNFKRATE